MTPNVRFRFSKDGRRRAEQFAEAAVAKIGDEVLADAVQRCPQDTGALANSLTRSRPETTAGVASVSVGTTVEYAPFVEYGTRYMAAQPYLGPALEAAARRYGQ